jgi:hypothetical protein
MQSFDFNTRDPLIKIVAKIIPLINGKDLAGNVIYLGPKTTAIHRYLLVIYLAKTTQMFRLLGKEIDNSVYFTMYRLKQIADSFKQVGPYHTPIRYDRTKVAGRVYNMISNSGLVSITKSEGETYITITDKGEDISTSLLPELIAYGEIASMSKKTDSEEKFIAKGVKSEDSYTQGLQSVQKRLAEKITEINSPFEDELETIEED